MPARFELELSINGIKLELRYTEDTAIGSDGNALPDTIEDLQGFRGTFYYDDTLGTFLKRVKSFGIPMDVFPGTPTTCEFVGETLVCYAQQH